MYTVRLLIGLSIILSSCDRAEKSDSRTYHNSSEASEQESGGILDKEHRKRFKNLTELDLPESDGQPGIFLADGFALNEVSKTVFHSELLLDENLHQTFGTVRLGFYRTTRLDRPTQEYMRMLRHSFFPKCQTLVQSELNQLASGGSSNNILVEGKDLLSAEKISNFMTITFRLKPTNGSLHEGAKDYAKTFQDIISESPNESRQNIYASICLAILTDPRTFIR